MEMMIKPAGLTTEHNLYIFTFGGNQPLAGKCQPIYAVDAFVARQKMMSIYGSVWAFMYTAEQWEAAAANNPERHWTMETPLLPIVVPVTIESELKSI